ncbi:MAG: LysM peptidoglycan-binding domain-containing protein [Peptococcaceae bacterium]|nr:LysM peptidoglycan-binding domain-containing protein [Peptococcaceae bacterium]
MNLPQKLKRTGLFIQGCLKKISWSSPPVLGCLLVLMLLLSGTIYAFSSSPAKAVNTANSPMAGGSVKEAYTLEIDGSIIAYLPTQEAVDQILKEYQDYYTKPSEQNQVASVAFSEKVTSQKTEVPLSQIQQPEQVLQMLIAGKTTSKDYTVQANDSWWLIARKSDMQTKEVLAGNPGATEDSKLEPGQIIKLVSVTPYLTVISSGTFSQTETIPYDTVTRVDSGLGAGQKKVVTEGSNGSKLVNYSYEQKNGVDVKKQVVNEQILTAAVTQVIAKGPSRTIEVASRGSSADSGSESSQGSADSSSLVEFAKSLVGTPYVFGGMSKTGFDCSGYTKYVFAHSGITLPRTSFAQFASGTAVSRSELRPGDLVFFTTYAKGASHVGIYIGGGRFVHADNPRLDVTITSLSDGYYSSRYLGARRYN